MNEGTCHLCRSYGPLSFEHFPPKSCCNEKSVRVWTIMDAVRHRPKTRMFRRGLGKYALCAPCNNFLGVEYVPSLLDFTIQGQRLVDRASEDPVLYFPFQIRPLRVLKAIVAMTLAATDFGASSKFDDLRSFIRNPASKALPSRFYFYTFFNPSEEVRLIDQGAACNFKTREIALILAEIAIRPFGYVAVIGDEEPSMVRRKRLCRLNGMATFDLSCVRQVPLRIPRRIPETATPFVFQGDAE